MLDLFASLAKNSREVGVKLSKDVLQQVEVLGYAATNGTQELEEGVIKEEMNVMAGISTRTSAMV